MDIVAQNLGMQFDDAGRVVEVFREVSFCVSSGESIAVTGESGVGKTTLIHLLGGLECPTAGDVLIGETDLSKLSRGGKDLASFRGRHIGFIFQSHHLLPEFDARENVAMPLIIQGAEREDALKRASGLLQRVGLSHRLMSRPGTLSGGEQQRVSIARALVASPGLVLADEPTGSLDRKTGGEVMDLLLEMQKEKKTTLVLVTHSLELAGKLDRCLELSPNGIVEK